MSYRDLNRQTDQFAAALASLGVGKGSHVAIMLPNMPQEVIAYFGILKAGATIVNTNPTYPAHELEPLMRMPAPRPSSRSAVCTIGCWKSSRRPQIKNIILTDIPDYVNKLFRSSVAKTVRAGGMMKDVTPKPGTYFLHDLLAKSPAKAPSVTIDPAKIRPSSSSPAARPGLPKAAELTHHNLIANITQVLAWVPSLVQGQGKAALCPARLPRLRHDGRPPLWAWDLAARS